MPNQHAQRQRFYQTVRVAVLCLCTAWVLMGSGCAPSPSPSQPSIALVSGYQFLAALKPDTSQELWRLKEEMTLIPPLLANGVVYFSAGHSDLDPGTLEAVRAKDGTQLWSVHTETTSITALAIANGVLFATEDRLPLDPNQPSLNPRGTVSAYRASDGKRLWQDSFDGRPSQPTVADGIVYVATGALYAYSASDGHLLWSFQPAPSDQNQVPYELGVWPQLFTPLNLPMDKGLLFAEDTTETVDGANMDVVAFDAHTGKIVWRYPTGGLAQPLILSNGVVFVESLAVGQLPTLNNVTALRASDGSKLWNYQASNVTMLQPVVANESVYVVENPATKDAKGDLVALRAADGSVSHRYTVDSVQPGYGYMPPSVSQGMLYTMINLPATMPEEELGVVALNLTNGSVVWRSAAIGMFGGMTPTVDGGVVYAYPTNDSDTRLSAFRASDGKPLWQYPSGAFIYSLVIGS